MTGERRWHVELVTAQETWPLRQRLLRPHQAIEAVAFPGDHDTGTGHFGVRDSGEMVGVVTVLQDEPERVATPDRAGWWRLRGMATATDYRRQGVGTALVAAARHHVAAHQGRALWCNARLPAVAFYRALGFASAGEPWDEPAIGPHITMWRPLDPPP